mmetsp:Transcript_26687/g.48929  ORF Transcript_26687/g.48929 Transcript_26687/m.48929 type:complete len:212 (-) Transcript_26687:127-762(-)
MPKHFATLIGSILDGSCSGATQDCARHGQYIIDEQLSAYAPAGVVTAEPTLQHHAGLVGRGHAAAFIGNAGSDVELLGSSCSSKLPAVDATRRPHSHNIQSKWRSSFASASGGGLPNDNNDQCGSGALSQPCPEPFLIKWGGDWKTIQMLQDMEEHKREVQFWGTAITGTSLGLFLVLFPRLLRSVRRHAEQEETFEQKQARMEREAARHH